MKIKYLENEEYEFERVTVIQDGPIWIIKNGEESIGGEFNTIQEAYLWAVKISKEVNAIEERRTGTGFRIKGKKMPFESIDYMTVQEAFIVAELYGEKSGNSYYVIIDKLNDKIVFDSEFRDKYEYNPFVDAILLKSDW